MDAWKTHFRFLFLLGYHLFIISGRVDAMSFSAASSTRWKLFQGCSRCCRCCRGKEFGFRINPLEDSQLSGKKTWENWESIGIGESLVVKNWHKNFAANPPWFEWILLLLLVCYSIPRYSRISSIPLSFFFQSRRTPLEFFHGSWSGSTIRTESYHGKIKTLKIDKYCSLVMVSGFLLFF